MRKEHNTNADTDNASFKNKKSVVTSNDDTKSVKNADNLKLNPKTKLHNSRTSVRRIWNLSKSGRFNIKDTRIFSNAEKGRI